MRKVKVGAACVLALLFVCMSFWVAFAPIQPAGTPPLRFPLRMDAHQPLAAREALPPLTLQTPVAEVLAVKAFLMLSTLLCIKVMRRYRFLLKHCRAKKALAVPFQYYLDHPHHAPPMPFIRLQSRNASIPRTLLPYGFGTKA